MVDRYRRQTLLPEIGDAGQRNLSRSTAVVVGVGAVGGVAADLLARAGVGRLRIVDRDVVEPSNLQRQTLFSEDDVECAKADAAVSRLRAVNRSIEIEAVAKDVHPANVAEILRGADVVVDGTDNLETRYLLNEAALEGRVPFVYAGAVGTTGMVYAIRSPQTACFRCLIDVPPAPGHLPTCESAGILNVASSVVGAVAAGEALRLLVGQDTTGDLLVVDGWRPEVRRIHVARRPDCPTCVNGERPSLRAKRPQVLATLCGHDTVSVDPVRREPVDLTALSRRLAGLGSVRHAGGILVADVEGQHITLFADGRALIRGVADEARARSVYAKYVGV